MFLHVLVAFYSNQSLTLFVMEKIDFLSVIVASTNDHLISFQVRRTKHGDQYHKGLFGFTLLFAFLLIRCRCDKSRLVLLKALKTSWNYCKNDAPYFNHSKPSVSFLKCRFLRLLHHQFDFFLLKKLNKKNAQCILNNKGLM